MTERYLSKGSESIARKRPEKQRQTRTPVSHEIQRAGELFTKALQVHGVSIHELAASSEMSDGYWYQFAKGKVPNPSEEIILSGIERYIDSEDIQVTEIRRIFERRKKEKDWLKTFARTGSSFGRSIRELRLSMGLYERDFAQRAHVSLQAINGAESRNKGMQHFIFDSIINASPLADLDPMSKTIQFLRIQNNGGTLFSREELKTCSYMDMVQYLCILEGQLTTELSKNVFGYKTRFADIKSGKRPLKEHEVSTLSAVFDTIPDDILIRKAHEEDLGESDIDFITRQYLVQEDIEALIDQPSKEDDELITILQGKKTIGAILRHLRISGGFSTIPEFSSKLGVARTDISDQESSRFIPRDLSVVRFLAALNYSIHSPITQYILERAQEEREEQIYLGERVTFSR